MTNHSKGFIDTKNLHDIALDYQSSGRVFEPSHRHNLLNDLIRLPIIRCEFEEINAKCQMHTLRDLASHGNSVLYPNIQINDDTLGTSYKTFSIYLKSQYVNIYQVACTIANCFVCENSN